MSASARLPPTPDTPGTVPHAAMAQAAEWFALLRSGEATDRDRADWQAWLSAHPQHADAWACVERVSHRFEPLQSSRDPRAVAGVYGAARDRMATRRRLLRGVAACAGAAAVGWGAWRHTGAPALLTAWLSDHHATVGEIKAIVLADGTRIWLGSASAVDVDYDTRTRRLRLRAGELFIETAPDVARAFVVDTPHGRLRALGTRFNVRLHGDERTAVAVYDGAVEVRTTGTGAVAVLGAGQQRRFTREALEETAPADSNRQAWTKGILIARDMPLVEVIAELARYSPGHLAVSPDIGALRVFGSFPLGDTDRALAMLAGILPIRVRQPLPWWRSVEARTAGDSR